MKDLGFVKSREELWPTEIKSCITSGGQMVLNGGLQDVKKGLDFINYKKQVVEFIYKNNEVTLRASMMHESSKMCVACQIGLRTDFACKCAKDLKRFIFCDYIRRSLT